MRILHVTDTYLPTIGGIEVFVDELSARQHLAGHDTAIWTRTPDGESAVRTSTRPVVRDTPDLTHYDQVHCHVSVWSPLALTTAHRAAAFGVPVLVTVHSMWDGLWPLLRPLAALTHWADGVTAGRSRPGSAPVQWAAVSQVAADRVQQAIRPRHGVLVLPNAVDVDAWRTPAPVPSDRLRVVSTMRLAPRKRPGALVRSLARASRAAGRGRASSHGWSGRGLASSHGWSGRGLASSHAVSATIFGDGTLRGSLERAIADTGVDVRLAGPATAADLRRAYAAADVFVAPSNLESFGIAALEARAAGLAVIAKKSTGIADFITDGVDGFLVDSDTQMTQRIAQLAADPALRFQLRSNAWAKPPVLDWDGALRQIEVGYRHSAAITVPATLTPAAPATPVRLAA